MTVTIAQSKLRLEDPHDCTDSSDTLTLYRAFFDTLVRRDGPGSVPHLALSWDVSDDARTWVFHLRAGVSFHDGSGCDAAAVTTSLKRLARADKGYTLGAPGVWHQFLGDAEISADGDLTLRVVLSSPIADLLDILVQCNIVSPASMRLWRQDIRNSRLARVLIGWFLFQKMKLLRNARGRISPANPPTTKYVGSTYQNRPNARKC